MKRPIITFLSDFGTKDGFCGSVKGRIKAIAPQAEIIDISHHIAAFDIQAAAYAVLNYSQNFPSGSIHLAVVDPTVGGARKPIIIKNDNCFYVGPDNGLFSLVSHKEGSLAYEIKIEALNICKQSDVFHARDIFAPAAAMIANNKFNMVAGASVNQIVELDMISIKKDGKQLAVRALTIDHFGNIITGLHRSDLKRLGVGDVSSVLLKDIKLRYVNRYYAEKPPGEWLVLWNSLGFLEIAVSCGRAADLIKFEAQNDYIYIQTKEK